MGKLKNVGTAAGLGMLGGGVGGALSGAPFGLRGPREFMFGKNLGSLPADPIAKEVFETQAEGMRAQRAGLSALREAQKEDPTKMLKAGDVRALKTLSGGVEDTRRRVEEMRARRGLGATSLGMGQITGAQRQLAERQAELRASLPERVEALRRSRAQALLGAGSQVVGSQQVPIRFRDQPLGRSQGLFPSLAAAGGAIIGGIFGGPGGAAGGGQAGLGLGRAGSGIFGTR